MDWPVVTRTEGLETCRQEEIEMQRGHPQTQNRRGQDSSYLINLLTTFIDKEERETLSGWTLDERDAATTSPPRNRQLATVTEQREGRSLSKDQNGDNFRFVL